MEETIKFVTPDELKNICEKTTKLKNLNFSFEDEKEYHKILNEPYKIQFDNCYFQTQWLHNTNKEVEYLNCKFDEFQIMNISENKIPAFGCLFYNCEFKEINCEGVIFEKILFKFNNLYKHKKIEKVGFVNCEFKENFLLNIAPSEDDRFKITSLDLSESTFKKKVKIQFLSIENANFYNTKFEDLADFYQTNFNEVVFERTDFEKITVFSEAEFHQDVNFKYTKFLGKSIFRDTVIIGELNLRDTIFADEANFLDITSEKRKKSYKDEYIGDAIEIKVSNRETARIIKNFYDTSNNIIEANKFYALEMEKREYELKEAVTEGHFRFILESLIFKVHGITSNHSQDWFLSLLWILNITFMYTIFSSENSYHNNMLATIFFYSIVLTLFIYQNPRFLLKIILIFSALMFVVLSYINVDTVADKINPFSIMTSKDTITFGLLIFKITIAYLIYQFIVSVRQNTRRK